MPNWREALRRTRKQFSEALFGVLQGGGSEDTDLLEDLEERLLQADVPVRLADEVLESLQEAPPGRAAESLRASLVAALGPAATFSWSASAHPLAIMVAGVNGAGKTTTCAKLAHRVQAAGLKPLLAAADTFRAAGADQLKLWAQRMDVDVVAGVQGADAAAVAYDGLDAAMARDSDVLILDTAGRMHTKAPLIEELRKTCRALAKRMPDAPHERWLVLDASMGQNALVQARVFHEAIDLTGVIVAKLDGSSKAGFLFAVQRELGVPILFAGLGEGQDDLIPFDPEEYVEALLDLEPAGEGQAP